MKSEPLGYGPNSRSPSHGGWLLVLDFGVSTTEHQAPEQRAPATRSGFFAIP